MTICARILPTSTIINDSRQCKNRKELRSPSPFLARPNSSVGVISRSQIPQACPGVSLFGVCIVHHHRYALRPHCQCPPTPSLCLWLLCSASRPMRILMARSHRPPCGRRTMECVIAACTACGRDELCCSALCLCQALSRVMPRSDVPRLRAVVSSARLFAWQRVTKPLDGRARSKLVGLRNQYVLKC